MLSVVILAGNEEKIIAGAIKQVLFADEIVIVDDESTDKTATIARKSSQKVRVLSRKTRGNFSAQREFGSSHAKGDWVLFVDPDEVVSHKLAQEIQSVTKINIDADTIVAYYIKRRDVFLNREVRYGELWSASHTGLLRLIKKGSGHWHGAVHEVFKTTGKTATLENHLTHYPHPTIADFLADTNTYSTIRAQELYARGYRGNLIGLIFFPFFKFIYTFFIKLGFQDGAVGFIYSFMMSFHSFLVRAKLILKSN